MNLKNKNTVTLEKPKRIAIVIANPANSSTTGSPVGFWWNELTHPFYAFLKKGYAIENFSSNGGSCEQKKWSLKHWVNNYVV